MDVRVKGAVAPDPFLSAADLLETEYSLSRPVDVHVRTDPDERTRVFRWPSRRGLSSCS